MEQKVKLSEMMQAHGKSDISKAKELNDIFGEKDETRQFKDLEEYEGYLKRLDKYDLQVAAVDMGVFPSDNRSVLIERLKRNFIEKRKRFTMFSGAPKEVSNAREKGRKLKEIGM